MTKPVLQTAQEMLDFIARAPSCFHVIAQFCGQLEADGWQRLEEGQRWQLAPGGRYYVTRNGSTLAAFRLPASAPTGLMIAAAHSDAPTFKLKHSAELADGTYLRLDTEPYGSGIWASWLDRPLSAAGRAAVRTETGVETRLVDLGEDLFLIPSLAIHLDRKINEGRALNAQVDLLPLFGQAGERGALAQKIAAAAGVRAEQLLGSDLFLYLREQGRIWGAEREFLSSPRLDDLECAWSIITALRAAPETGALQLAVVFDNEEVGSGTRQGADSTFLSDLLARIGAAMGIDAEGLRTALAASLMVSADNGHALHPNFPEKAEPANRPVPNGGVVIKYHAGQKYTSDAVSAGLFTALCKRAGVPVQSYHNRSDQPGGSTLGNIANTHVSLPTVDIGLAQLAMHSCYETAGAADPDLLVRALTAFYGAALACEGDGRYRFL